MNFSRVSARVTPPGDLGKKISGFEKLISV
jgi:hypothetical protein